MRTIMIAIVLLGTACSKSEAPSDDAPDRARFIAAGMDAIAPKDLGNGLVMTDVKADGAKITVTIKGVNPRELALPDFNKQAKKIVCADRGFRGVIEKGVAVALNLKATSGGGRSVKVESC
jgi:hypothetical protein